MEIRCTCSKRYLFKIEIEKYYEKGNEYGNNIKEAEKKFQKKLD